VNPGIYKEGVYQENVKVYSELTIITYSSLTGKWTRRTYVSGAVPGGDIIDINSAFVTIYDNLSPEEMKYLEDMGYSPVALTEWERKPDLEEYGSSPAYRKWYDAGEIVGINNAVVTGYVWKKTES
jgi:hypothetical protein